MIEATRPHRPSLKLHDAVAVLGLACAWLTGCGPNVAGEPSDASGGSTGGDESQITEGGGSSGASSGGTGGSSCFSPTQNSEHAYDQGAVGCSCDPENDPAVCVGTAALIALVCEAGTWQAVEDGPCGNVGPSYSPDSCKAAGGIPVPSQGGKQTPGKDCASGMSFGIIGSASSGWDEGGLCCAPEATPPAP